MQSLEYQNKSVFFVGDIALSGDIGIESLDLFCSPLNALKKKGDLLIANLEIPISTPAYTPIHVCNTEILEAGLRLLGVTHVNLANNHILDGGLEGLRRTLVVLERLNIQFTGVSLSENYCDPILFNCKGRDIALLGYVHPSTHVKNHPTSGVYINIWNPELAQTEIQKWTAQGYEVWVSIHWGDDYSYCVNRDQVDIATNITAWGACLIMGHHAHVVQPMHLQGNNVCFFGLGGYVFGHFWKKGQWSSLFRKTKKGLVIKLDFQNDGTKKFLYFQSQENWNHQVVIRQWNFVEWSRKLWVFSKIKHSNAIIRRLFTIFETQTCKFHHQMSSFGTNGWSKFLRRIDKSV